MSSTTDVMLSNITVIARNLIYQAFLSLSAVLCFTFCRFSLPRFFHFPRQTYKEHWQLSPFCLELLACRGLRAPDTKNGGTRRRLYFFSPESRAVIIVLLHFFLYFFFTWNVTVQEFVFHNPRNYIYATRLPNRRITSDGNLKPRDYMKCIFPETKYNYVSCSNFRDMTHSHCFICCNSSFYVYM